MSMKGFYKGRERVVVGLGVWCGDDLRRIKLCLM